MHAVSVSVMARLTAKMAELFLTIVIMKYVFFHFDVVSKLDIVQNQESIEQLYNIYIIIIIYYYIL